MRRRSTNACAGYVFNDKYMIGGKNAGGNCDWFGYRDEEKMRYAGYSNKKYSEMFTVSIKYKEGVGPLECKGFKYYKIINNGIDKWSTNWYYDIDHVSGLGIKIEKGKDIFSVFEENCTDDDLRKIGEEFKKRVYSS
jgi:hypothetical protein